MRNLRNAIAHLKKDPILSQLILKYGVINYRPPKDRFENLVSTIIGQQLSNAAAETIYNRFKKICNPISPQQILDLDSDLIRSCGTSWAKVKSLKDLSAKVLSGQVQLNKLDKLSDAEVITHLTQVIGIGPWTAEMKLMFTLQRPDILPLDDVGIQNSFVKHFRLNRKLKSYKKVMEKIASPWRPYRTLACWYLWKSLDNS